MKEKNPKYEVFISGETVDLVVPNESAIDEDGWHSWFNSKATTKYLEKYGLFPNTKENQRRRLQKLAEDSQDALVLMVLPKNSDKAIGITHIAGIDWKLRSGHYGLVMGAPDRSVALYQSLESKALMVEHAFEVLGLERIWGKQVVELELWQRYQVLFGFKPEGITRRTFRKGQKYYDEVITSCLIEDYLNLKEKRNGRYWPGRKKISELMRTIPNESLIGKVSQAIQGSVEEYIKNIKMS